LGSFIAIILPGERMVKTTRPSRKKPGRTIADSNRRFTYDAGGRKPLTQFPLVPITVTFPADVREKVYGLSEQFIDPLRLKPYGIAAVCRVLLAEQELEIQRADTATLLAYAKDNEGSPGRSHLAEKIVRIGLLVPKHIIEKINERVIELDEPLIGTATIIRWLIMRGMVHVRPNQLYAHIPPDDMSFMIRNGLTVDHVIRQYRDSVKDKA